MLRWPLRLLAQSAHSHEVKLSFRGLPWLDAIWAIGFPDPSLTSLAPQGYWTLGASHQARELHLSYPKCLSPLLELLSSSELSPSLAAFDQVPLCRHNGSPESSSQVSFPFSDHQPARSVLPKRSHPSRTVRLRRFYDLGGLTPSQALLPFSESVALRVPYAYSPRAPWSIWLAFP